MVSLNSRGQVFPERDQLAPDLAGARAVAGADLALPVRQQGIGLLLGRLVGGDGEHLGVGVAQCLGQGLGELDADLLLGQPGRPNDHEVVGPGSAGKHQDEDAQALAVGRPSCPHRQQRPFPAGGRRGVDEAALLQGLDAVGQHLVRNVDALFVVDLLEPFDQLGLAPLLVELAAHQVLAVAQGVHHVHGDHEVVERLRLLRRSRGLGHVSPRTGSYRPLRRRQRAAPWRRRRGGRCASCPPPPRRGSRPSSASTACASRR